MTYRSFIHHVHSEQNGIFLTTLASLQAGPCPGPPFYRSTLHYSHAWNFDPPGSVIGVQQLMDDFEPLPHVPWTQTRWTCGEALCNLLPFGSSDLDVIASKIIMKNTFLFIAKQRSIIRTKNVSCLNAAVSRIFCLRVYMLHFYI